MSSQRAIMLYKEQLAIAIAITDEIQTRLQHMAERNPREINWTAAGFMKEIMMSLEKISHELG
jgi:predicted transcriptional regulator